MGRGVEEGTETESQRGGREGEGEGSGVGETLWVWQGLIQTLFGGGLSDFKPSKKTAQVSGLLSP